MKRVILKMACFCKSIWPQKESYWSVDLPQQALFNMTLFEAAAILKRVIAVFDSLFFFFFHHHQPTQPQFS
jgi:hypothetical protein